MQKKPKQREHYKPSGYSKIYQDQKPKWLKVVKEGKAKTTIQDIPFSFSLCIDGYDCMNYDCELESETENFKPVKAGPILFFQCVHCTELLEIRTISTLSDAYVELYFECTFCKKLYNTNIPIHKETLERDLQTYLVESFLEKNGVNFDLSEQVSHSCSASKQPTDCCSSVVLNPEKTQEAKT